MAEEVLFSAVIPTYNRAVFLKDTLESILLQTFEDFEIIVADDGSTDNTRDVVASFKDKRLKYIYSENWGGPARPRNLAIKQAKGKFIAFCDSDDLWHPKKLETISNVIEEADVFYHDLDMINNRGEKPGRRLKGYKVGHPVFTYLLTHKSPLYNSGVIARKEIIERVGGLCEDKRLIAVEDYDLWLRMARVTERFRYINKSLGSYRFGDGNITEISDKQIERLITVYEQHLPILSESDKTNAEAMRDYAVGRIYQKMNNAGEARKLFWSSLRSDDPFLKLKSAIMLSILCFTRDSNYK